MTTLATRSPAPLDLSVVIPVYNEEESLESLFDRLFPVLDKLGKSYEVIFTNDGSRDNSIALLKRAHERYPDRVKIIDFNGNFGQHMAIMAAFEQSRGEVVINLDADLQNPPEEIPRLLAQVAAGHDYVGSIRDKRKDNVFRTYGSKFVNWVRSKITDIRITDQGCMMRAYHRHIIDSIVAGQEAATFIPALGYKYAWNPTEIVIKHVARQEGDSKYTLYELARVTFDLATSFSLVPIQMVTFFGMVVSASSFLLVAYLILRRLFLGPEVEGVFTLFAIVFFLLGVAITGIGIIGEYVGRTYQAVSRRPRFVIREIVEPTAVQKTKSPVKVAPKQLSKSSKPVQKKDK